MFSYRTEIHLRDTDATGVLYFAEQFRLALEAFEHFLKERGLSLNTLIKTHPFLMPIVHAEGDYFAPLEVGDKIEIFPTLAKIGTSSFSIHFRFVKQDQEVGKVSIVHVVVDKKTRKSVPMPDSLREILHKLPELQSVPL